MSLQQTPMAQHSEPFETMAKLLFVDKDIIDPGVPQLEDGSGLDHENQIVRDVYGTTRVFFMGYLINVRELLGGRWCTGIVSHTTDTVEMALHAMDKTKMVEFRMNAGQLYRMNVRAMTVYSQQGTHHYGYWVFG